MSVTNAEGNQRILPEEAEQLQAIAQVTEIESLEIEVDILHNVQCES